MGDVVALPGSEVPPARVNAALVGELERYVQRAKSGEIHSLVLAAMGDVGVGTLVIADWDAVRDTDVLGMLETLKFRLLHDMWDEAEDVPLEEAPGKAPE